MLHTTVQQRMHPGVPPTVTHDQWPMEKGDEDGERLGNGERTLKVNLTDLIPRCNIIKGK